MGTVATLGKAAWLVRIIIISLVTWLFAGIAVGQQDQIDGSCNAGDTLTKRSGSSKPSTGHGVTATPWINRLGRNISVCGTIDAGLVNGGTIDFSDGTTVVGPVSNETNGTLRFRDSQVTFNDRVENAGVIEALDSEVRFEKELINSGALLFDPSTITVSTMTIGPNGYLTETGDPGDRFIITEDFINQSTQNILWQTSNTIFQFNGGFHDANDPQTLEVAGADIGNELAGWTDNFVFGTLEIGTSTTYVRLLDDYNNSGTSLGGFPEIGGNEAIYVENLTLEAGITLDLNNLNLYVLNTFTNNGASILNGTVTLANPVPDGDINVDGKVNVADAFLAHRFLLGLAVPTAGQLIHADVAPLIGGVPAPDGQITLADVTLIYRKALGLISF